MLISTSNTNNCPLALLVNLKITCDKKGHYAYLPVYKSTTPPPSFWSKKISFSYFWVRIFWKNLSFILEFSCRYATVTRKICPEPFFYHSFWPMYNSRAIFWTNFQVLKGRLNYTGKYGKCAPHSVPLKGKTSIPKLSLKEESNKSTDPNVKNGSLCLDLAGHLHFWTRV